MILVSAADHLLHLREGLAVQLFRGDELLPVGGGGVRLRRGLRRLVPAAVSAASLRASVVHAPKPSAADTSMTRNRPPAFIISILLSPMCFVKDFSP